MQDKLSVGLLPIVRCFQLVWSCPREARFDWLVRWRRPANQNIQETSWRTFVYLGRCSGFWQGIQNEVWMHYCNFSFLLWWAKLFSCLRTSLSLRTQGNNLKAIAENSIKVLSFGEDGASWSITALRYPASQGRGAALPLRPWDVPGPGERCLRLAPPLPPLFFTPSVLEF